MRTLLLAIAVSAALVPAALARDGTVTGKIVEIDRDWGVVTLDDGKIYLLRWVSPSGFQVGNTVTIVYTEATADLLVLSMTKAM